MFPFNADAASQPIILIAGVSGTTTGFLSGNYGSMTPPFALGEIVSRITTRDSVPNLVVIQFDTPNLGETFWSKIIVTGIFTGGFRTVTFDRVAENYSYTGNSGGDSLWQSIEPDDFNELMINGNDYTVRFEK